MAVQSARLYCSIIPSRSLSLSLSPFSLLLLDEKERKAGLDAKEEKKRPRSALCRLPGRVNDERVRERDRGGEDRRMENKGI
jgi:hypothetical protein